MMVGGCRGKGADSEWFSDFGTPKPPKPVLSPVEFRNEAHLRCDVPENGDYGGAPLIRTPFMFLLSLNMMEKQMQWFQSGMIYAFMFLFLLWRFFLDKAAKPSGFYLDHHFDTQTISQIIHSGICDYVYGLGIVWLAVSFFSPDVVSNSALLAFWTWYHMVS